ncbi:DedA family protein [Glaciecola siphonariae]|uniref:DedA family protein n=1 Tax=Glaciecola siphonariae TaxID=521012 RepID=A0ABV9LTE0_9ALTE
MKYASFLPLSALVALGLINLLVHYDVIPPGMSILENLQGALDQGFYAVIFLIILLESIIYVGFYFPGQFFAVLLVIGAKPTPLDVLYLTLAMVLAATIGSMINYYLGKTTKEESEGESQTKLKHLLLAMIHINSLAFFMFSQGANNKSFRVVWLAGLLNLPYYLLLIAGTAVLSEEVMAMAENTALLFTIIGIWLAASLIYDVRKHQQKDECAS